MLYEAAEDSSREFTYEDADQVAQTDAVIAGHAPDGTHAYLLAEASITVVKDDVDRAKDRAQLLVKATGDTIYAVVIGETITEDAAKQAGDRAVTYAHFSPRRHQ